MVLGTKVDVRVTNIVGPLAAAGNIGESRFKGKVNEFGFRHFEFQVPMGQTGGNFSLEPRKFESRESVHVHIFSFVFLNTLFNP